LVGLVRPGAYSWRVFDGVGRLSSVSDDLAGSAADRSTLHGYNPAGQLVSLTRNNDAYAWSGHYAATRAYSTNGLNQYAAAGGATFAYDANGNLASDGANVFTYDVALRARTTPPSPMIRSGGCGRSPTRPPARSPASSTTATRWSPNMTARARCCGGTSTAPAPMCR
jgi:hypothetical protein